MTLIVFNKYIIACDGVVVCLKYYRKARSLAFSRIHPEIFATDFAVSYSLFLICIHVHITCKTLSHNRNI